MIVDNSIVGRTQLSLTHAHGVCGIFFCQFACWKTRAWLLKLERILVLSELKSNKFESPRGWILPAASSTFPCRWLKLIRVSVLDFLRIRPLTCWLVRNVQLIVCNNLSVTPKTFRQKMPRSVAIRFANNKHEFIHKCRDSV